VQLGITSVGAKGVRMAPNAPSERCKPENNPSQWCLHDVAASDRGAVVLYVLICDAQTRLRAQAQGGGPIPRESGDHTVNHGIRHEDMGERPKFH